MSLVDEAIKRYARKINNLIGACPSCGNEEGRLLRIEIIVETPLGKYYNPRSETVLISVLKCNTIACSECKEILLDERGFKMKKKSIEEPNI